MKKEEKYVRPSIAGWLLPTTIGTFISAYGATSLYAALRSASGSRSAHGLLGRRHGRRDGVGARLRALAVARSISRSSRCACARSRTARPRGSLRSSRRSFRSRRTPSTRRTSGGSSARGPSCIAVLVPMVVSAIARASCSARSPADLSVPALARRWSARFTPRLEHLPAHDEARERDPLLDEESRDEIERAEEGYWLRALLFVRPALEHERREP